jgi:hypothetical protein
MPGTCEHRRIHGIHRPVFVGFGLAPAPRNDFNGGVIEVSL